MVALLAIAVAWAHKVGEWKAKLKPIMMKKFLTSFRPQYSFFRYGLDHLRQLIFQKNSGKTHASAWRKCLDCLFGSPPLVGVP
jgi:hypothetical protein